MRIPHPILRRRLFRRAFVLWVLARLLFMGVVLLGSWMGGRGTPVPSVHLGLLGTGWFLVWFALLAWIDLRRRREHLLFGNLGYGVGAVLLLMLSAALTGETVVAILVP